MTIPAPGGASDGLVRPLNAPQGQQVLPGVQPGVSGQVVLAQYVIIFGTSGGLFIYSGTPGPGNPPVYSISNATEDPYGNAINPGIFAGQYGGTQSGIQYNGSYGQLVFPVTGSSAPLRAGVAGNAVGSGGSSLEVFSAQDTAPNNDRVLFLLQDHAAIGTSAVYFFIYQDANGTGWEQAVGGNAGLALSSVSSLSGVLPGTGTSSTNAAQPETWHQATPLSNSWAGSGSGVNGLFYRVTPDGEAELIADILNATATGNSTCFTLPAGYRPATSINLPVGWNNPQASNAASAPWLNVSTGGAVQITGIEAANHEVFFRVKFPLGSL